MSASRIFNKPENYAEDHKGEIMIILRDLRAFRGYITL